MFPTEETGNSLTMTILQELWCDALWNDAPLGATWMWGGGARWGGGTGGLGCPGPGERDTVRERGTGWLRWTGGHWGSLCRLWGGKGAGGRPASGPRWGGYREIKVERVCQKRNRLLPIRNNHDNLLLFLCCPSWCFQRYINQTLPLSCSLFPRVDIRWLRKGKRPQLSHKHSLGLLKRWTQLKSQNMSLAWYINLSRCAQLKHNIRHTKAGTHAFRRQFNAAPNNWKMTSPALCLHQTALHPLFLPLTPNENHMPLTENTNLMVMHNSLLHLCATLQHKRLFWHSFSYPSAAPNSIDHGSLPITN